MSINDLLDEANYGLGGIFQLFRQRRRERRRRARERGIWLLKPQRYGESAEEGEESDIRRISDFIRDELETSRPGIKVAWVGIDDVGPDDPEWQEAEDLAHDGHEVFVGTYTEPVYGKQFPEAFREGNYEVTALYVRTETPEQRRRRHPLHRYSH